MKYKVEHHPNPDALTIHVNTEVTRGGIDSFRSPDDFGPGWGRDTMPEIVTDLFGEVSGITEVTLSRYQVFLIKGKVFKWDEMLESIMAVLKKHLSPDEEMEAEAEEYSYTLPRDRSIDLEAMDEAFDHLEVPTTEEPADEAESTEGGEPETDEA